MHIKEPARVTETGSENIYRTTVSHLYIFNTYKYNEIYI